MRIRFWGTRGSIPVAQNGHMLREKVKRALLTAGGRQFESESAVEAFIDSSLDFSTRHGYGGDTSCIQIEGGPDYLLCDMGSGLRRFGQNILETHGPQAPNTYHFLMSHLHWDHIMGFPFFPPAYIPGNAIRVYGGHPTPLLEEAFHRQQSNPCFPVYWDQLGADIQFIQLDANRGHEINGFRVTLRQQAHHGDSYSFRFEKDRRVLVYATDAEHKQENEIETDAIVDFYREADLVVFDAMYSLADMVTIREDWGHSSNIVGVDLCLRAKVKHYCMFHHEPACSDDDLETILTETRRYAEIVGEGSPMTVSTAYDDRVIDL